MRKLTNSQSLLCTVCDGAGTRSELTFFDGGYKFFTGTSSSNTLCAIRYRGIISARTDEIRGTCEIPGRFLLFFSPVRTHPRARGSRKTRRRERETRSHYCGATVYVCYFIRRNSYGTVHEPTVVCDCGCNVLLQRAPIAGTKIYFSRCTTIPDIIPRPGSSILFLGYDCKSELRYLSRDCATMPTIVVLLLFDVKRKKK